MPTSMEHLFKPLPLSKWLGVFNSPMLLGEGELLCGMLGEDRFLEKGHFNLVRWTKEHGGVVDWTRTPGSWELYL